MSPLRFASVILTVVALIGCEDEGRRESDAVPAEGEAPSGTASAAVAESAGSAGGAAAEEREMSSEERESPATRAEASGVTGKATIGPACPVVEVGVECPDRPYATNLIIRDAESGRVVASVESDADGRFRIGLDPGEYLLEGEPRNVLHAPKAEPVRFEVTPGELTEVIIRFDSGIR